MGFFSSIARGVVKRAVRGVSGAGKLVKGLKSGAGRVIKGAKATTGRVVKGVKAGIGQVKNLFTKSKPQGVVKETIIKKGTRPLTKIVGKFDEGLIKIRPIGEISKKPFVRQTLTKAQRLKNAKSAMKAGRAIKNLF